MYRLKYLLFPLVALICSMPAADALSLPVKRVNGKAYYYYTVGKKDRFYELSSTIGVKRSDILKYNPQAADGLQAGMVLTFPVEIDAEVVNGYYTTSYRPSKGESIYGVAKHFDVPVDRIIEFNPEANEGVRDLMLTIPLERVPASKTVKNDKNTVEEHSSAGTMPYVVMKGETLTKIALKFSMTVDRILAVNPGLSADRIAAGQKIRIPLPEPVEAPRPVAPTEDTVTIAEVQPVEQPVTEEVPVAVAPVIDGECYEAGDTLTPAPVEINIDTLKIAVMLPFMLNDHEQSKATQLITEFYRGFLLGAETLSHSGDPVAIYAYDTAASTDTVSSILGRSGMQDIDVFVGPGDEDLLSLIVSHANNAESYVLNTFAVKNDSYKTERSMIQANIPHSRMYAKAIEYFVNERYKGFTPVFISRVDGAADKIEFVTMLKERLDAENIPYKEIVYRNFLGQDNLEDLNMTDSAYVFVPVTGSRIEFNKFAPALKNFKNSVSNPSKVLLFGYPEWITFRNEQLDMLQSLNTLIYSRFFGVAESPLADKLNDDYKSFYGIEMLEAAPSQGLLGYDTAIFLIKSLRNNEGDFSESSMDYDGVQSGFSLVKNDGEQGLVNDNLYFIDFLPDGITTKIQN